MSTSKKSDKTHEQRFRNREHARKTRERKKEQLSNLQGKIRDLFEENTNLSKQFEVCSAALSLQLIGNSPGFPSPAHNNPTICLDCAQVSPPRTPKSKNKKQTAPPSNPPPSANANDFLLLSHDKTAVRSQLSEFIASTPLSPDSVSDLTSNFGTQSRKRRRSRGNSVCSLEELEELNELGEIEIELNAKQDEKLSGEQLKKEKNRLHARRTRVRKKAFVTNITTAIETLERENTRMRGVMRKYSIEISDDCAQCHDTNDKGCGNGGNNYCLSIDSPESFREEPYQLVG